MEPEQGPGAQTKKSNKPQMEKKRRERINNSLNELKSLILGAMKKDASYYSKLEKADILEMAVEHVRTLQKQLRASRVSDSNPTSRYREGFAMCASEVTRLLMGLPGLDENVKVNIIKHMAGCCSGSRFEKEEEQPQIPVLDQAYNLNNNYESSYDSIVHYSRIIPSTEQKITDHKRNLYQNLFAFHGKSRKTEQNSNVSSTTGMSSIPSSFGSGGNTGIKQSEHMMLGNGLKLMPTTVLVPVPVTFPPFQFKSESDEEKKLWRPW